MGGKCPSRKVKKRRFSHKQARRTKFELMGDDAVYDQLQKPDAVRKPMPFDEDLPGMGQHYCLHCDRFFANVTVRDEHFKTKKHRRRVKMLNGPKPHTQLDAELAGGSSSCSQAEREALINFKIGIQDPSGRLSSWDDSNGDCCKWHGVECHNTTAHVIELQLGCPGCGGNSMFKGKISPSLLGLRHLRYLDLSGNDFQGIPIPGFLGSMSSLNALFLGGAGFAGAIPHQLGNLSNLQRLSLRAGHGYVLHADTLQWLPGLSSLRYLNLREVDLSKASDWLSMINTLPSLSELYLSSCRISHIPSHLMNVNLSSLAVLDLYRNEFAPTSLPVWISHLKSLTSLDLRFNNLGGPIPDELQNLTSIRALQLSFNDFNGSIPDWLFSFPHLEDIDFSGNNLVGKISSSIGNLTSLVDLDLSINWYLEFEGGFPASIRGLCQLSSLSLSGITVKHSVSDVLEILGGDCPSETLQVLTLGNCQLFGQLTDDIGKLKRLNRLVLSNNSINGPLPASFGGMASLENLRMEGNNINGTLPASFGQLAELINADISQNSIEGVVSSDIHFAKLTKLASLCAAENKIVLEAKPGWVPPKQLEVLDLSSWYVGPHFPVWLREFEHLLSLDLSNSGILEPIPDWFWGMRSQFFYLNMSHNQIPGRLPNFISVRYFDSLFDLSWNSLEGPLPVISSNMTFLDLSNNLFSGNLLKFLCFNPSQARETEFLDLHGNLLSGEIPDCWRSWQNLKVLRLGNNNLKGKIPESIGSLSNLLSLRIQNSSLSGAIPSSLANCSNLVSLDLADNVLEGNIPDWIGERGLWKLSILNLRGNKFQGKISEQICSLQHLQILDLSHNFLSGNLPQCVGNLSAMSGSRNDDNYDDDQAVIYLFFGGAKMFVEYQVLVAQGQVKAYSTILNYVRSLDLSWNNLSGEIPEEITRLGDLKYVNLSRNSFSGGIPGDLASMTSLESLDLSGNKLSGAIPPGLASLTFLNHLNLSYNSLSGRIPSSTQLQSFGAPSFMGNEGLCGLPLSANCSNRNNSEPVGSYCEENEDHCDDMEWYAISIVLGFLVGFWGVVVPIFVNRRWRSLYFGFLDHMGNKLGTLFMPGAGGILHGRDDSW
ncbi:unnamed protein product [Linum tenue]|uniref:C2H2-type domain-containing protein n=1 Tax=Linum tenue TaxID=586396 RepID=A0AAV0JFL5_9ROSI|nr:unnamed protein product [Linum tenue]